MNADSKHQAAMLGQFSVDLHQPALHLDGGFDGGMRVREIGHDGVADGLDDLTGKLLHDFRAELGMLVNHGETRSVAKAIEVRGRTNHVREEDSDQILVAPELFVDLGAGVQKFFYFCWTHNGYKTTGLHCGRKWYRVGKRTSTLVLGRLADRKGLTSVGYPTISV